MSTPSVTVFRTSLGIVAQRGEDSFLLAETRWDKLFTEPDPAAWLHGKLATAKPVLLPETLLAPIENQEVWAAGVTYLRSRDARMEEAKEAGGGSFYDRVYDAVRPEIFFKATPHRVVGNRGVMRLRGDSKWNVPEPEITLAINRDGRIFGYTIGNDLSSRDIEGENPLYLPQAKVFNCCCALGPGIVVRDPLPRDTAIQIHVWRAGAPVSSGETSLAQMKRSFTELAGFLFRDNDFPRGCFLLTGTGTVPANDFTLASGDEMRIHIAGLGTLVNTIA